MFASWHLPPRMHGMLLRIPGQDGPLLYDEWYRGNHRLIICNDLMMGIGAWSRATKNVAISHSTQCDAATSALSQ